ncbi:MAG: hypothetical protein UY81_C0047G0003 [Candidatus Giovannonibacteria bacterium GW2011_GWA2_53_7]|uniref:Uncharacterized protein n=1 Tax=Candidatus Giovannonibacteria bacterium GW2011_GWA2_53_7 TaxID=1618650 RepID=A0A0G1XWB3_9BACT|nr:MAG: hypothetical protein UY81_C0047G0003 [Candidatus Giovannonibacteria bacterium GW2011_GWA2_53_7]
MRFFAELKTRSQIQLAIVLHRFASFENSFKEIFEGFETHFVQPLTVEEVGTLVRKPLEGTRITFTDDAIQKIVEFTGGRPMEIQNLCQALMDPSSENKHERLTYRAEDINELIGKKMRQLMDSFHVAIGNYQKVYDRSMSDAERAIIDSLIEREEIPVSEIDETTIQPLVDTTFVTKDETKKVYRINGTLFKRVISEK